MNLYIDKEIDEAIKALEESKKDLSEAKAQRRSLGNRDSRLYSASNVSSSERRYVAARKRLEKLLEEKKQYEEITEDQIHVYYREKFRSIAISRNVADECVIDSDYPASLTYINGCYKDGQEYIVYCTDERSHVSEEWKYPNPEDAYLKLLRILGVFLNEVETREFKRIDVEQLKKMIGTLGVEETSKVIKLQFKNNTKKKDY